MTALWIVVVLLMLVGLVGSLLPGLPGAPLILLGAGVHAAATGGDPVGVGRLFILAGLAALAFVLNYVAAVLGARRFGASGWAVAGAVLGALAGVFFAPAGLLLGPVVGAVTGELVRTRRFADSLKSGLAAVVGLAVGAVAQFALALVMVALFAWWVWRG